MLKNEKVNEFSGDYEFLRNDFPCIVSFEGDMYPSVEHAFQAAKTNDVAIRQQIRGAVNGNEAKRIGRKISLSSTIWKSQRSDIMSALVRQKFTENVNLKIKLLLTGNQELIQGNCKDDQFWGQTIDGVGENTLGKILMRTRAAIRVTNGSASFVLDQHLRSISLDELADNFAELQTLAEVVLKYKNQPERLYEQLDLNKIQLLLTSLK